MKRTVKDVMTAEVVVVQTSMPYKEIARLMESKDVSAVPVVDETGNLVGIASESGSAPQRNVRLQMAPHWGVLPQMLHRQ